MRDVAYFADLYRPAHPETRRWHYVNIAMGAGEYEADRDCQQIAGEGDCIIAAIARNIEDLKATGERQQLALKFLVHFVGDLHQPFHAVTEARGGNEIRVTFFGKATNLHAVWDTDLIRKSGRIVTEYPAFLEGTQLKGVDEAALIQGTTINWALASRALGLKAMVPNGTALSEEYVGTSLSVIDQQLALAGIRLAAILNHALR